MKCVMIFFGLLVTFAAWAQDGKSPSTQYTLDSSVDKEINQLEKKIYDSRARYFSLTEDAAKLAIQAEASRRINQPEYHKLWDQSEKMYEEAELVLEDIDKLILQRNHLVNAQIRQVDDFLRELMDKEKEMEDSLSLLKAKRNQAETDEDKQVISKSISKETKDLENMRAKIEELNLKRKFLLWDKGDPDDSEFSPYQP